MAHYAKVESGTVTQVIVAEQDFIDTLADKDKWVQTSYNTRGGKHYDPNTGLEDSGTPLRKNYAGVGMVYDESRDAFYTPQPYPSWTLNTTTFYWDPPVPYPSDGKCYKWDEIGLNWVKVSDNQPV
tara:strand:- start:192 stop:569 length:378 start_codon:yes stop_codon:yes gene_type:complete